jgi:hypothetical protein
LVGARVKWVKSHLREKLVFSTGILCLPRIQAMAALIKG